VIQPLISSLFGRRTALAVICLLGSLGTGLADDNSTLLPQEQVIANYMVNDPNQGRPTMIFDPLIEGVARARAKDMAVRNYFSHVNPDGVAANYLLRKAGYELPSWWTTDPSVNYVESIAAGYASPATTWTAWMNSPPHKVHILGQNSFFASETHYGVGYYYDPSSTYQYYWVIITAPPQPLEIMTPAPASKVLTPSITVAGTSDPGAAAASVQFRVENSNGVGAYQVATGVTNWSGTATALVGGSNVIRAQSLDGSGNVIDEKTCAITYFVQGTLTVGVSGSGVVTSSSYVGVTTQTVGNSITLKAAPAAGSIFTGWTGSVVSGSTSLKFTMQDGLNLQANFEPNPFPAVSGGYYGIVTTGSGGQSGLMQIAVSGNGLFTGRVNIDGRTWGFSGHLDPTGFATVTIPRNGEAPLVITVQVDLTGGSGDVTGTVSDGTTSFDFTSVESAYNPKTNSAPQAGRYTVVLAPDVNDTSASTPQGSGYAVVVVGANGTATVTGCLADGTPYSTSGHVADNGTLALFWSAGGTTVNGLLTFEATNVSDVDGTITWTRAPKATSVLYPAGFTTQLPCVGSRFTRPVAGLQSMDAAPGPASADFGGGNIPAIQVPVTVSQADRVTMVTPGLPSVNLSISTVSGVVMGSFVPPGGNGSRAVRGVVIQKQQSAFGYFNAVSQVGYFSLAPGA